MNIIVMLFQITAQTLAITCILKMAIDKIFERMQSTAALVDHAIKTTTDTIEDVNAIAFETHSMIKDAGKVINTQLPALVKESRMYVHEARQRRASQASFQTPEKARELEREREREREESEDSPEPRVCCFAS